MPVRSDSLVLWEGQMANPTQDLYTCPAGVTAIIKDVTVMQLVGAAKDVGLSVRRGAARGQLLWQAGMAHLAVHTSTGRFVVLLPGDVLELFVAGGTGTGKMRVLVGGSELAGVAPA